MEKAGADALSVTQKTQASLRAQILDAERSTAVTEMTSLRDIRWGRYLRHKRMLTLVIFVALVMSFVFFVYWSLGNLQRDYPDAYKWWNDPLGYGNTLQTPFPNGIYPDMTVPNVAIAASYPPVAWLQGLMFKSTTPVRSGCLFLLKVASQYGYWANGPFKGNVRLKGIHWNGSSEQLRFSSIDDFLPLDAPSRYGTGAGINWGYVWASWNRTAAGGKGYANPWAYVIWSDIDTFSQSPMISGYYAKDATYQRFMASLFTGGFCAVAMDWFEPKTDPDEVLLDLFGFDSGVDKKPCSTAQLAASSIQYGSLGFSILGAIGAAMNPFVGIGLALAGASAGAAIGATVLKPNCGTEATAGGP